MTFGPECLDQIIAEVNNLETLNSLYELTIDGERFQWLSLEPGMMIDFALDIICAKYENWNISS